MELIFLLIIAVLLPLLVQNREVNTINKTQGWVLLIAGVVSFSVAAITVLVGIVWYSNFFGGKKGWWIVILPKIPSGLCLAIVERLGLVNKLSSIFGWLRLRLAVSTLSSLEPKRNLISLPILKHLSQPSCRKFWAILTSSRLMWTSSASYETSW